MIARARVLQTAGAAVLGSIVLDFMDFSKQCEAEELRIRQRAPELSKHLINLYRWEYLYPEPRQGDHQDAQPWQMYHRLLHQTKHEHNAAAVDLNNARIFVKGFWEDVFYADKRRMLGSDIIYYLQVSTFFSK
eukprot:TRINITY_DN8849_c0_g1_i1.p1 TRINITY_DN8849_c0_g1~~TRINITY_DN8849_c0_g1_i1.p1  ORF type:complete len:133 (+),score=12.61 TRINITY_DN8849_c0_g1_i1:44-442(+)